MSESQADIILRLLRNRREGITALEALDWAGCFRLAARISDLRAAGNDIRTEMVALPDGKRIARYYLVEPLTLGLVR